MLKKGILVAKISLITSQWNKTSITRKITKNTEEESFFLCNNFLLAKGEKMRIKELYGVRRNYMGLVERKYIYDAETLIKLESDFMLKRTACASDDVQVLTEEALDGYEGAFWANDTYTFVKLEGERQIVNFILNNYDSCDCEDPTIEELVAFKSAFEPECMYSGEVSALSENLLTKLGIPSHMAVSRDNRYYELIHLGMPEEDMFLDWGGTRVSSVYESLEKGSYETLKKDAVREKLQIDTPLGTLSAYKCVEPNPAICTMFEPAEFNEELDLAMAEVRQEEYRCGEEPQIAIMVWGDVFDESYTHKTIITKNCFKELAEIYK